MCCGGGDTDVTVIETRSKPSWLHAHATYTQDILDVLTRTFYPACLEAPDSACKQTYAKDILGVLAWTF